MVGYSHNTREGVRLPSASWGLIVKAAENPYRRLRDMDMDDMAAIKQSSREAEAKYGLEAHVAELEGIRAGALRGGSDVLPHLHMVGNELAEKTPKLTPLIQKGQEMQRTTLGTEPDDHEYQQCNESIQIGKAALAHISQMPEGREKNWMIDVAQKQLSYDRSHRRAASRGQAYEKAQTAKDQLDFLNKLLHDADKMCSWHA